MAFTIEIPLDDGRTITITCNPPDAIYTFTVANGENTTQCLNFLHAAYDVCTPLSVDDLCKVLNILVPSDAMVQRPTVQSGNACENARLIRQSENPYTRDNFIAWLVYVACDRQVKTGYDPITRMSTYKSGLGIVRDLTTNLFVPSGMVSQ